MIKVGKRKWRSSADNLMNIWNGFGESCKQILKQNNQRVKRKKTAKQKTKAKKKKKWWPYKNSDLDHRTVEIG